MTMFLQGDFIVPVAGIAAVVVLIPVIMIIVMYNRLVNLRQLCKESFSDIDTELQRRHDLIPNLVNIVKGYAKHEQELLERITQTRARAVGALDKVERAGAAADQRGLVREERELGSLLGDVIVVAEKYPDLKADESFRRLMKETSLTEDRIQAARRFYNGNVRELNNACQQFPSTVVAKVFGFEMREFFEVDNPLTRAGLDMRAMLGS